MTNRYQFADREAGAPDTDYARSVVAQRFSAENPDRQEWEREWTAMRNRRDVALRNLAGDYRAKMAVADRRAARCTLLPTACARGRTDA